MTLFPHKEVTTERRNAPRAAKSLNATASTSLIVLPTSAVGVVARTGPEIFFRRSLEALLVRPLPTPTTSMRVPAVLTMFASVIALSREAPLELLLIVTCLAPELYAFGSPSVTKIANSGRSIALIPSCQFVVVRFRFDGLIVTSEGRCGGGV